MTKITRGAITRTGGAYDSMDTGSLTATWAAVPLAASPTPIIEVVVQNDPNSGESAFVGNNWNQHVELVAGASITIPINDLSAVYVRSVGGAAIINWLAMR